MIFDKLTEIDKQNIEAYIDNYATAYSNGFCEKASLDVVLSEWNKQKERLFHLFGNKLIVSQEISYQESIGELNAKLEKALFHNPANKEFERKIMALYPYEGWVPNLSREEEKEREKNNEYHNIIDSIFDIKTLRTNKYEGPDNGKHEYSLPLPNKPYKIQDGMKPMKILKKLADTYNISGFEEFRNAHSRCLQTKEVTGELCFSIHPLDYMTMSDNNCDWDSCMSWRKYGEYRIGTVEMMNSPSVVVVYLKSNTTDYDFPGGSWNSKKWRCLFIVDNDFIVSVKSYPFYNKHLVKMATTKLAELIGWGEIEPTQYDYENVSIIANNNVNFYLGTDTVGMYNDFGSDFAHWVIVNPYKDFVNNVYSNYDYCYSGQATCMNCGKPMEIRDEGDETALVCADLDDSNYYYCEQCNERIRYSADEHYVEDCVLCDYCFENYTVTNAFTEENIFEENAIHIVLSCSNDKLKLPQRYSQVLDIWVRDTLSETISSMYQNYFVEGFNKFHYDDNSEQYWIAPNELTKEGLRLFNIYSQDALKHYMANSERNIDFY